MVKHTCKSREKRDSKILTLWAERNAKISKHIGKKIYHTKVYSNQVNTCDKWQKNYFGWEEYIDWIQHRRTGQRVYFLNLKSDGVKLIT